MKIKLGLGELTIHEVAEYCNGDLYDFTDNEKTGFSYICTDSREADRDTMFVALRGERVDGHDYIGKAIQNGCRCILCEYSHVDMAGEKLSFAVVENTLDAFSRIAECYRRDRERSKMFTVAITGSVGKTTTKEFTTAVLAEEFKLFEKKGNYNSVIGMPMSLLEAGDECNGAVFEMGMSSFGEIEIMSKTARPDIAMITNIGSSHLEYLKTRENIALAKSEIISGLADNGLLLLDHDEPLLENVGHDPRYRRKTVSVTSRDADIYAYDIKQMKDHTLFSVSVDKKEIGEFRINAIGEHLVKAACFAVGAGTDVGMENDKIRVGLLSFKPVGMRQNIVECSGYTLIEDCYNASPESVKAALNVLATMDGKRVCVLGEMYELGDGTNTLHREVGRYAEGRSDLVICCGKLAENIAIGAKECGVPAIWFEDIEDIEPIALETVKNIKVGDTVLFKASRGVRLERVAERVRSLIDEK